MAKKDNKKDEQSTHGFGSVDWVAIRPTQAEAGARSPTDSDWVRRDREWKEYGNLKQKFS